MVWWHILLIVVIAYFIGNISFARFIAHKYHGDLTKVGSGNPGATNVMRSYGLKVGAVNVVLDLLKGVVPCLIVALVFPHIIAYKYICGLAVVVGHIYPVIFKFKGGKGWSTVIGVFWVLNPILIACVMVLNLIIWYVFKYSSVATLTCASILAFVQGIIAATYPQPHRAIASIILFALYLLILWAHRSNIKRLLLGSEGQVDLKEAAHRQPPKQEKPNKKQTLEEV